MDRIIAIRNTHSNVKFTDDDGAYDIDHNLVVLDENAIATEMDRLTTENTATAYKRERHRQYPTIRDQLDALYHAGAFPDEMAAKIKAIKDQYPKP